MYTRRFQDHPTDESALSRFEVLTKSIYKWNQDRPYYAEQFKDIFIQYHEGFDFLTGKDSEEFRNVHKAIPNKAPSITPYTKADIRNGFVIPKESQVYGKSENYEIFQKQHWFGAVHPNVQIDAKLDYMTSPVLL